MLRLVLPPSILVISKHASFVFISNSLLLNPSALMQQITTPYSEFNAKYLFPFHTIKSKIGAFIFCFTRINLVKVCLGYNNTSLSKP